MDLNWWLSMGGGGALLSLILGPVGIWISVRLLDRKILRYSQESTPLIGRPGARFPPEVKVTFAEQPVQNLTRTNLFIWNSGNATLHREDVASNDPIRLQVSSRNRASRVLAIRILKVTGLVNDFKISVSDHEMLPPTVPLDFEYLNPGEGAAVEILHSGPDVFVELTGTIKGARHKILRHREHLELTGSTASAMIGVACLAAAALIFTRNSFWSMMFVLVVAGVSAGIVLFNGLNLANLFGGYPKALRLNWRDMSTDESWTDGATVNAFLVPSPAHCVTNALTVPLTDPRDSWKQNQFRPQAYQYEPQPVGDELEARLREADEDVERAEREGLSVYKEDEQPMKPAGDKKRHPWRD